MRTARIISESDIVPNRSDGYRLVEGRLEHQEWVAPKLNTTADGALYLTVLDLARWAVGLNHLRYPGPDGLRQSWTPVRLNDGGTYPYGFGWSLDQQRGFPRIGHTGSWQGFKASIQRYPEQDLTVIALANLAEAPAGGHHPRGRRHSRARPASAAGDPGAGVRVHPATADPRPAAGHLCRPRCAPDSLPGSPASCRVNSGTSLGELLRPSREWSWKGCDDVSARRLERLGSVIQRICYAAGRGKDVASLVEVDYAEDARAAFVDWYDY